MLSYTVKVREYALDTQVQGKVPVNLVRELLRRLTIKMGGEGLLRRALQNSSCHLIAFVIFVNN